MVADDWILIRACIVAAAHAQPPPICPTAADITRSAEDGGKLSRGFGCDNAVSTTSLTDVQKARSVMFEFRDTSCIEVTYDIGGGPNSASGRNFLFAGRSFACNCTYEQSCTP